MDVAPPDGTRPRRATPRRGALRVLARPDVLVGAALLAAVLAVSGWSATTREPDATSFAAQRHPAGGHLEGPPGRHQDPTLIATGFDGLPVGPVSPVDFMATLGGTNNDAADYTDTSVVEAGAGHGEVLRTTLRAGTVRDLPDGAHGIVVFPALPSSVHRACLAYDVRFDPDFDWSLGGKLPGLLGVVPGSPPSLPTGGRFAGDQGWSGRLMWLGPGAYRMPGRSNSAISYMYGPHQTSEYGDNLWWHASFRRGVWQRVKQCYRMNTVGRADGVLQAWLDGRPVLDRSDYVFRTRSDVAITHLTWSVFRGGHTPAWASPRTDTIDFDNVVVTGR